MNFHFLQLNIRICFLLILSISFVFNASVWGMEDENLLDLSSDSPSPKELKRLKRKSEIDSTNNNVPASINPLHLSSSLELDFTDPPQQKLKRLKRRKDTSASLHNGQQELSDAQEEFDEDENADSSFHLSSEDNPSEELKTPPIPPALPKKSPIKAKFKLKEDSDEEDQQNTYSADFTDFPAPISDIGLRLKIMANAYLQKVDQTANIFFPHYTLEYIDSEGKTQTTSGFFRTSQKSDQDIPPICAFASGGFQNAWEQTVSRVQTQFFEMPIKIIRALWMTKHLPRTQRRLEEEYKGRENELHSEFFYDLFFRHFFIPTLPTLAKGGKITHVTINAFSWWEVCNTCEDRLSQHQALLPEGVQLTYKVAASRRYNHHYPLLTPIMGYRIPYAREITARQKIWGKVLECVRKEFPDEEEKSKFWTETFEGLELCKWLGQTFVESEISSTGTMAQLSNREDVLKINKEASPQEIRELTELITYLRDVNWDLSCWYKPPTFFDEIQKRWRTHWRQVVLPHFDWEIVYQTSKENMLETPDECEMCGCEEVRFPLLVFHPKHRVSKTFLALPREQQKLRAAPDELFKPPSDLADPLRQKRKQSISVGSTCVGFLQSSQEELDKWRQSHPDADRDERWERNARREIADRDLEKAEKELEKKWKSTSKKKKK